jgi:NAD(P)-dependent dehydrogenase (short-subunit alcohol dehydrogenase family)
VDLASRLCVVTGSARRLGREIVLTLAREGANVVVHYGASQGQALATVEEARRHGVEAESFRAELTDAAQIAALFDFVWDRFGRLDVLVNNASSFHRRRLELTEAEDWDRAMAINARAPFLCLQHAARLMRQTQRDGKPGLVVNLADLSGVQPWPGYVAHGASKAALLHLTRVTALELAPDVRVNALVPGAILPPPGVDAGSDAWRRIYRSNPSRRPGSPADVAEAVVYLAHADYVTGAVLPVDGGQHLVPRWER